MIKDIEIPQVTDVAIAIIPEHTSVDEQLWGVYFLNLKNCPIESVFVSVSGYGEIDGRKKETATVRLFLDVVPAASVRKLEGLQPESLRITNQYWVSFYSDQKMYDKKYIFLPESVTEKNYITIPLLHSKGVMIR